ncbi:hypothetical protein D8I24_0411 (plasmid) [Cupriavidus necator H850]|nr:hypothetical protein D8I24_0411 [Cupriavidus necator H850]
MYTPALSCQCSMVDAAFGQAVPFSVRLSSLDIASRMTNFCTHPVMVIGISATKQM